MCMAIPSLVIAVRDMSATVECFGVAREVSMALLSEPIEVGDYVVVRAGRYVVERVDRDSALQTLSVIEQLFGDDEAEAFAEQRLGLSAASG